MARPYWKGSISFGLVNVPVALYPAVRRKDVRFHLYHDADGGRIREKRVCTLDDREVPWEHVVKGYEVSKGQVVTLTQEELRAADPERASGAIQYDWSWSITPTRSSFTNSSMTMVRSRSGSAARSSSWVRVTTWPLETS